MLGFINNYLIKRGSKSDYQEMLTRFLSDGKLDESERKELEALASKNGLSKSDIEYAHKQATSIFFKQITGDERITREEKEGLESLMSYFDISTKDFEFNQGAFNKYYSLALIEKGVLPTPEHKGLNVIFKSGEKVHWLCPATTKKLKRITDKINYSALTGSVRLMKGVRYRVGSVKLAPSTREVMVDEDSGMFWLSNQRIGFLGGRKNFTLPYNKVLSFEIFKDGISIHKEGKDNPYFIGLSDVEVPAAILSSILNN